MKTIPFIKINAENFDESFAQDLAEDFAARNYEGAFVYDISTSFEAGEKAVSYLRAVCNASGTRVIAKVRSLRMEDIKKILYAGCAFAAVDFDADISEEFLKETAGKFGKDKLMAYVPCRCAMNKYKKEYDDYFSAVITRDISKDFISEATSLPACFINTEETLLYADESIIYDPFIKKISWDELKKNGEGLVPCIVQDVKNGQVLMMAYMNRDAYEQTLSTGRMTYFSRSRGALWIKGETSGHFQYLKSLCIDCDNDTLLAKVEQTGAACHTGNRSCFYTDIYKTSDFNHDPATVFQEVYDVILDRKTNPKEGSYTNYLFEKGIDKILKKMGEEAVEIVIAAKNPDKEEIKYEIADFLYHAMVLMAEKEVTWDDITKELARR